MTESKEKIVAELKKIVGDNNATDDPAVCFAHTRDQFVKTRGPDYVVLVSNRDEISKVLKFAYEHSIPVVPKGTGANISGAVIPERGGIILDLKKMNRILEIDKENMTATIEPGVSMGQLQIEAWKRGLFVPEPSGPHVVKVIANLVQCRGISTYSAKYGVGDQHILGYEWVMPNGEIVKMGCFANPAGEKSDNWAHVSGPDLSGIFLFAFGTLGVCTKAKIKLYPKKEDCEGGAPDKYMAIAGDLDKCFTILKRLVNYDGVYSNIFMTRWPYLAMMFGQKKKDTHKMMKRRFFESMITLVLEGSERRLKYYAERLEKLVKGMNLKKMIVGPLDAVQGQMMKMTSPPPHSMLEPIEAEPRRLIDFMFMSARAFRVHGAFGGNTPYLSLDDAYDIFKSTELAATEYAPRPYEIACYFQPIDDYHYALQEMDLYFDMFDPVDSIKSFAGHQIGSYYSILRRRDCLVFYIYFAHDFNEAVMPLLAPGYMRILKNWKTHVDPKSIMNRKKGILADKDYDTMEVDL
ncbi:MAG: FAD-binding oxidoreductase [Promethearchaeota archaeon]